MVNKKYYSISEAQQILTVPTYKLRYLEKITRKLKICKIEGRRYYTTKDIEYLKNYFIKFKQSIAVKSVIVESNIYNNPITDKQNIYANNLEKIDTLIVKFKDLSEMIKSNAI